MKGYVSLNPYTGEHLKSFKSLSSEVLIKKLEECHESWLQWKHVPFEQRALPMKKCAALLRKNAREFGRLISIEMGKPIVQATAEVEKCAWVCDHYAANAEKILAPTELTSDYAQSYVRYDPIGVVLAVMPWNFPFWQVFRFVAPALMAGNAGLLKHASNVPQCAMAIQSVIEEAGFPRSLFLNLYVERSDMETLIAHPLLKAVTLTGSEVAGSSVASLAGKHIKKTVLELGGSDPFVVLDDADLDKAIPMAVKGRFQNSGQSCIAAKRFIVQAGIYEDFVQRFKEEVEGLSYGDPMEIGTETATLARPDLLDQLIDQVDRSVYGGARILTGGRRSSTHKNIYVPTILVDIPKGTPAYSEELFGPVASVFKVTSSDEALALANSTEFGLGASIWSEDRMLAEKMAIGIDSGSVFINSMVASDPRLPFGGVKMSGYGRELAAEGIKEFMNVKTIAVN